MTEADLWGFIAAYFSTTGLALYLQYRSHMTAIAKLSEAHDRNSEDLRQVNEVLRTMIDILRRGQDGGA
jgi:hypothetical protein